jgi:hypothetical protein
MSAASQSLRRGGEQGAVRGDPGKAISRRRARAERNDGARLRARGQCRQRRCRYVCGLHDEIGSDQNEY